MRYVKTGVSTASNRGQETREVRDNATRAARGLMAVFLLLVLAPARADVVADWNTIALHTVVSSEQRPASAAIELAMVHVAMFEVMNFIEGAYVPRFVVKPQRPFRVSSGVAAAAAAHHILVLLHPEHKLALDAALDRSMAAMPDAQEKSSALVTGKALGANIYAIWTSDPSSADRRVAASKTSRIPLSTRGTAANSVAWYWIVGQFIEAQGYGSIESARLYALVSMALSEVYGANRDTRLAYASECAPCAAGAAIQVILESELASTDASGRVRTQKGATGAAYTSSRIREYLRGVSLESNHETDNRTESIVASEEIGRGIGLRALANYRPSGSPTGRISPDRGIVLAPMLS